MVRSKVKASSQRPRAKRPGVAPAPPTIQSLEEANASARAEYSRPKNTGDTYDGHVGRGVKFLKNLVLEMRQLRQNQAETSQTSEMDTQTGQSPAETSHTSEMDTQTGQNTAETSHTSEMDTSESIPTIDKTDPTIDLDALEKAFDNPPNKYSVKALKWFLWEKCYRWLRGDSTGGGIAAAFVKFWIDMDPDVYDAPYRYDKATDTVTGCPGRAKAIKDILHTVSLRQKAHTMPRLHAEAIRIEDLEQIVAYSEAQASSQDIDARMNSAKHPLSRTEKGLNKVASKHLMMRAYMATGFTIWLRLCEGCSLRGRNIKHRIDSDGNPYFVIFLERRKGWQSQSGYNSHTNRYHIYKQDVYAMDMYTHLKRWLDFLDYSGQPLGPDDFVFPHVSTNGTINRKREMTQDIVQRLIDTFAAAAGLEVKFTTHSFRRGGAQYRYDYAPDGQRWALYVCRWWGSWAEGEQIDTLMKYLIDSRQSREMSHVDMLRPKPKGSGPNQPEIEVFSFDAMRQELQKYRAEVMTTLQTILSPRTIAVNDPTPASTSAIYASQPLDNIDPLITSLHAPLATSNSSSSPLAAAFPPAPSTSDSSQHSRPSSSSPPSAAPWPLPAAPLMSGSLQGPEPSPSSPPFATAVPAAPSMPGSPQHPEPSWSSLPIASANSFLPCSSTLPTSSRAFPAHPASYPSTSLTPVFPGLSSSSTSPATHVLPSNISISQLPGPLYTIPTAGGVMYWQPHPSSQSDLPPAPRPFGRTNSSAMTAGASLSGPRLPQAADESEKENTLPDRTPTLIIPKLCSKKGNWRDALKQWTDEDQNDTGTAMKDWSNKWPEQVKLQGLRAALSQRRTIAEEYAACGATSALFLAAYPSADEQTYNQVLVAIRDRHGRRRKSKNGSAETRSHTC